jgi:hypothetical protein
MRREARREPVDLTDVLIAQLSGKPIRTKTFDVIAFSKKDRAAFARVASLMDKARGLLDDPDSDADYEMARLEHAATEFADLEHIEVEGGDAP